MIDDLERAGIDRYHHRRGYVGRVRAVQEGREPLFLTPRLPIDTLRDQRAVRQTIQAVVGGVARRRQRGQLYLAQHPPILGIQLRQTVPIDQIQQAVLQGAQDARVIPLVGLDRIDQLVRPDGLKRLRIDPRDKRPCRAWRRPIGASENE